MKKISLLLCLITISFLGYTQCITNVDFNTWNVAGQPGNGNWVVQGGGSQVRQTVNGSPTFFVSPFDLMNVRITGSFRSTDFDDDWMGFVFSFLNPLGPIDDFDCWLFDWKQDFQNAAPRGMSLSRAEGVIPPNLYGTYFNAHQNGPEFTVVQNNFGGPGWSWNTNHNFEIRLTYTRVQIFVDGSLIFEETDCFKPGRFGFYNYSQRDCYYSNFQYDLFIDFFVTSDGRACVGMPVDFEFVNPCFNANLSQYANITWNFGDGSPPVVINNPTFANANVSHAYQAPGNYTATLTVTDINGCSASATRNVEIRNPITINTTLTEPLCNGGLNGRIAANPVGGFGNYVYDWNGGANSQQVWNGLSAGTYTLYVTDGICSASGQYTLNQPTPLTATTSHTDASCGVNNGTVTIQISGGTPPYQNISWAGIPGATRTGLGPNTYIANFNDFNGCSALLQYRETVSQLPCGITTNISRTNVSCFGGNNGTITLVVSGGSPPSNISWSNNMSGGNITGLVAGTYTYIYSDAVAGNNFSGSVTITQPGAPMTASLATIGISCAGNNDGQAIASVPSGGTPPYTYTWSGGQPNNPVASGLSPGTISVTITDANGCTATASGSVSGVPSLTVNIITTIDSCYRSGKGTALANVSGGTPPYSYSWSNFSSTELISNLIEGNYTVTITDNKSCTVSATGTVTGPAAPVTYTYVREDVNCFGESNGSFNINVSGGTPGYNFNWTPSSLSGSNPAGLLAGEYRFTITDSWGCTVFGLDTILQPDTSLTVLTTVTNVSCHGANDGTVEFNIFGGTPPYTYLGQPIPAGVSTITNLSAGTFSGDVIDSNGCSTSVNFTITEPFAQSINVVGTNNLCHGETQGTASADFINATGSVNYLWTGGLSGQTITGLAAGTYEVTATDQNNCQLFGSIDITEPFSPISYTSVNKDIFCFGDSTGSIDIIVSGGTPGYSISWDLGSLSGFSLSGLPAGEYGFTISDTVGCVFTGSDTIFQPNAPLNVIISATNVTCNGANNGTIEFTISGGTPPYTYLGQPIPLGSSTINNLAPGTYGGNVSDSNSCTFAVSATITEPLPQSLNITGTDNPCYGANQGTASADFVNATGSVNYSWTGGLNGQNITGLSSGTYEVTATDQNNCQLIGSVDILEPAPIVLDVNSTDALCFGGTGSATAIPNTSGIPPFLFEWSNGSSGQTVTILAGTYNATATAADGCKQVSDSFTITQPSEITTQIQKTDVSCFGLNDGSISLTPSGGTGTAYNYTWNGNISSGNTADNLIAGDYDVTITDNNACESVVTISITEPASLGLSAIATDVLCNGDNSGSIVSAISGGTAPIIFSISEDGVNFTDDADGLFSNLLANTYTIRAIDNNSCAETISIVVNEPAILGSSTSAINVSCYGFTDGRIIITANGGSPSYEFSISSETNSSGVFSGLNSGNYTFTITDANNCIYTETVEILQPDIFVISVVPDSTTINFGDTIQLEITSNDGGDVLFNWTPATGLSCNDCASPYYFSSYNSMFYTVTAVNESGCSTTENVIIVVKVNHDIFIPNAFSPNGDGANDVWKIYGNTNAIKQINLMVFDRWGEKVFESDNPNFEWDGNYNGKTLTPNVFVYSMNLIFHDGFADKKKGSLTILR